MSPDPTDPDRLEDAWGEPEVGNCRDCGAVLYAGDDYGGRCWTCAWAATEAEE